MKLRLILKEVGWLVPLTAQDFHVYYLENRLDAWMELGTGTADDPSLRVLSSAVVAYQVLPDYVTP